MKALYTTDCAEALDLLSRGAVRAKPLISHVLPLAEWEAGFELVTVRKGEAVKVLLAC